MANQNAAAVASIIDKLKKRKRGDTDTTPKKDSEVTIGDEDGRKKQKKKRQPDARVGEDAEQTPEKKEKKKSKKSRRRKADIDAKDNDNDNINITEDEPQPLDEQQPEDEPKPKSKDKKQRKKEKKLKLADDDASALSKHKSIRQKLDKVKVKVTQPPTTDETTPEDEAPPIDPKGLEPLPQPEQIKDPKRKAALALSLPPWLAAPITVTPSTTVPFNSMTGISPKLLARLETLGLSDAFAVQSVVVPLLLKDGAGDICISAATGSGKTLSYILPIIQSLSTRVVTRLRAVVVVPTRELVSQVLSTAVSLTSGTGLKVGNAVGSKALMGEQALLIDQSEHSDKGSKVDILITTPGRLVEHIKNTPNFCLAWVKWLVIDEADRLLAQSFQEWVDVVIGSIDSAARDQEWSGDMAIALENLGIRVKKERADVRKVVLSATMTRDSGKLAGLRLRRPTMVVVENAMKSIGGDAGEGTSEDENESDDDDIPDEVFSVPMELREYAIPVMNTEYKPLHLMYLLRDRVIKKGTIVFVKSNEGAARLSKLIEVVVEGIEGLDKEAGWTTGLVTGEMEKKRREKVLRAFKKGEVHILVCSDLISRGLDLPHVDNVVNYDIPSSTRAYVHRVGRTARAGKEGDAFTLLADKEARWFWRNISKGIRRRDEGIERLAVGLEEEGMGWRGVYEGVLYG